MYIISFEIMYSMEANDLLESDLHLASHNNSHPYLVSQSAFPITATTWSFERTALCWHGACGGFTFCPVTCPRPSSEAVGAEAGVEKIDREHETQTCHVWLRLLQDLTDLSLL